RGTADEFVFGQNSTAAGARTSIDAVGRDMVRAVDKVCSLSPVQRQTLELAAAGETKRFFDLAEVIKAKFETYESLATLDEFLKWAHELDRLSKQLHEIGLFGERSLFGKVLNRVLTGEQASALAGQPLRAPLISLQGSAPSQPRLAAVKIQPRP